MPRVQGRKRSRVACKTCRDLKRKCDGAQPCATCVRFEYICTYQGSFEASASASKRRHLDDSSQASPLSSSARTHSRARAGDPAPPPPPQPLPSAETSRNHIRSLEANSGAAFLRRLALRLDPKDAPQLQTFAWNAFLGARKTDSAPVSRPITDILSYMNMQSLATVYFEKVDPVYGFLDRQDLERTISGRWTQRGPAQPHDAVLCGIAALGFLFSDARPVAAEQDLVESARRILEQSLPDTPTVITITAWVLRVVYLRIAENHHAAWIASSILMHMVEAAGLHLAPSIQSVLSSSREEIDLELRSRLVAVAQHLNIWMSFDMGRSRVTLPNVTIPMPSVRPGDLTIEIMSLLPYSAELDPTKSPNTAELEAALDEVLSRRHSAPPSVLAQCNLALCLCRRLQSMNTTFTGSVFEQLLSITSRGIQAAQAILEDRAPWHHMVNVPFQIVCVLLAMDTSSAVSQLKDAMQCLQNVTQVYNTDATRDALKTASLLILLQQRRKEKAASVLGSILEKYPVARPDDGGMEAEAQQPINMRWLNSLAEDLSGLPYFEVNQLLAPEMFKDGGIMNPM